MGNVERNAAEREQLALEEQQRARRLAAQRQREHEADRSVSEQREQMLPCPECGGKGTVGGGDQCPSCAGSGFAVDGE
jgi:RecJ-like exonuclease